MSSTTPTNGYSEKEFVKTARMDETQLVQNVIARIGEPNQPRTIVFQGERGSGKSFLAVHLRQTVLPHLMPAPKVFLLGFAPPDDHLRANYDEALSEKDLSSAVADPRKFTRGLVEWLAEKLGAPTAEGAELRDLTGWLVRNIEEKHQNEIIVLICDSIFELDWKVLKELEHYFLGQLAALKNVVIILTGRGRLYPWESLDLRVNVASYKIPSGQSFDPLEPFTEAETIEQLKSLNLPLDRVKRIYELSGGYPLVNRILGQELAGGKSEASALAKAADELFSVVPEVQRRELRRYFEALSILDGFRESEMPILWAVATTDPTIEKWNPVQVRAKRDEMTRTDLMRWEDGRYIIDRPIRLVLENYLKEKNPDLWRRLHCRAYRLYKEWANDIGTYANYYNGRAEVHASALKSKGYAAEDCNGPDGVPGLSGSLRIMSEQAC